MNLLQKIESRRATVAVIGLGYVGLPVAVAFARAGFPVVGIDISEERIRAINQGESYIPDIPSKHLAALTAAGGSPEPATLAGYRSADRFEPEPEESPDLQSSGRLWASTDFDVLCEADAVIICVPTPLGKTKDPNLSHVVAAADAISKHVHPDMLIVLESTTYPGTTLELVLPRLERANRTPAARDNRQTGSRSATARKKVRSDGEDGPSDSALGGNGPLRVGRDFYLAFSPERIDPGRADYTFENTPKVIGGVTPQCTQMAEALYGSVIERIVPVSSPTVAEMVKLLENTFRAVNIALVNEMAIMCDRLSVDVWEVIEAAKTKPFGFLPFYPGPGLGGHCIPIDPQYLAWKLKSLNYYARFIQLAAEINSEMPRYVLGTIARALNGDGKALKGARVLILGVSYKANVADIRESPALELIPMLQQMGAELTYHDPHVPALEVNGQKMASIHLDREALRAADCAVILTAHSYYDWEWVVENSQRVVDTRNATRDLAANPTRVIKL